MKQQNDNILGAPAEGFGQNITFAFSPQQGSIPSLDSGSTTPLRGGVYGSPTTGTVAPLRPVEQGQKDPTLDVLMKLADSVLEPQIKRARADAFVTGMQKAASGEAIKDIADGQPWYTKIFGDSDVVEGARQYTAQAKAADVAGAVEDSMHEVRKLEPDAAHAYYTDLISKQLTGDAATDVAVMQSFSKTLPATMRRQAKEHYTWRQEEASKAESQALMSAADLLQKRAANSPDGIQTNDEYAQQAVQFIAGMRPALGRDVKSWTDSRMDDLMNLAQQGKFHAVNAIKAAGFMDALKPDQRMQVEKAIEASENHVISKKSFEYAPEIGRIAGEAQVYHDDLSAKNTFDQLQALNDKFRKQTGIDRDLITLDKGEGVIKDVHSTLLHEGERRVRVAEEAAKEAAKANDKAHAEQIKREGAVNALSLGNAGGAARVLGESVVREEMFKQYQQLGASQGQPGQSQMLWNNYAMSGYVHPDIKKMLETRSSVAVGAAMPNDFLQLHSMWQQLNAQNPALADAYFGKYADRMATFDTYLTPGNPGSRGEANAFQATFGPADLPRPVKLDHKARQEFQDTMTTQHSPAWWNLMGQHHIALRDDQATQAMNALEPTFEKFRMLPGLGTDSVVRRALASSERQTGSEMLGGFFLRGNAGQQSLSSILKTFHPGDSANGTGEDYQDYWDKKFQGAIETHAPYGTNVKDPVVIQRAPDTFIEHDGKKFPVANLEVYYTGADGRQVPVRFTSQDIKAADKKAGDTARERKAAIEASLGTTRTGVALP
jgi:hypothetical protein